MILQKKMIQIKLILFKYKIKNKVNKVILAKNKKSPYRRIESQTLLYFFIKMTLLTLHDILKQIDI